MDTLEKPIAETEVAFKEQIFRLRHSNEGDHIFQVLRTTRQFYEAEFLEAISAYLKPGDLVVDAGANIGNHAIFFAGVCGARVVAFEPNPSAIALLRANVAANNLTEFIAVHEFALGAAPASGDIDLSRSAANLGAASVRIATGGAIMIRALDDLDLPAPPRLIKIDVEGMDLDVLRGGERTLLEHKPIVTVEAATRSELNSIADFLERRGYAYRHAHNYTPTHVFAPESTGKAVLRKMAREIGLQYVDLYFVRSQADARFGKIGQRLVAVESEQEKIAARASEVQQVMLRDRASFEDTLLRLRAQSESLAEVTKAAMAAAISQAQAESELVAHQQRDALELVTQKFADRLESLATSWEEMRRTLDARAAIGEERYVGVSKQVSELARTLERANAEITTGLAEAYKKQELVAAGVGVRLEEVLREVSEASRKHQAALEDLSSKQGGAMAEVMRRQELVAAEVDVRLEEVLREVFEASRKHQAALDELSSKQGSAMAEVIRRQELVAADIVDKQALAVAELLRRQEVAAGELLRNQQLAVVEFERRQREATEALVLQTTEMRAAMLQSVGELSERTFARLDLLDGELTRIGKTAAAAVEVALIIGAQGERAAEALLGELNVSRQSLQANLKQEIALAVADATIAGARRHGIAAAERRILIERTLPQKAPPDTPPRRRLFQAPPSALVSPIQFGGEGRTEFPQIQTDSSQSRRDLLQLDAQFADSAAFDQMTFERWEGRGWTQGEARLAPGGRVVVNPGKATAGVVSRNFVFAGGGLLTVTLFVAEIPKHCSPFLRVTTSKGERLGPDFTLHTGENRAVLFVPRNVEMVRVFALVGPRVEPAEFVLERLCLLRPDPEEYRISVREAIGEPVLASLASIPERRAMLDDCVQSLLLQCDEVRVYLNGYLDVPEFLHHPRVHVRLSQDWDDRGDAGKMFWLDKDAAPGYRLVADDDLIFPPDFAEVMCEKVAATDRRAVYSAHGVLLRQPFHHYYEDSSRAATFHFAAALETDRAVHIAGTGALCFHSSALAMKPSDFLFRNSADIWLALHAQREKIPLMTPARRASWVRESSGLKHTIYDQSRQKSASQFDSSFVQDAALEVSAPLTICTPKQRAKAAVVWIVDTVDATGEALRSWRAWRSDGLEWVVVLAVANGETAVKMASLSVDHELHVVAGDEVADVLRRAASLVRDLHCDAMVVLADTTRFTGKQSKQHGRMGEGAITLVLLNEEGGQQSTPAPRLAGGALLSGGGRIADVRMLVQGVSVDGTPASLIGEALGKFDWAGAFGRPSLRVRRATPAAGKRINEVFERVLVLNLDRRPDRWARAEAQLAAANIEAKRFAAVDGLGDTVGEEYAKYLRQPLASVSPQVALIRSDYDFYMRAPSQAARVAFLEQKHRQKAIRSRGAWGYLKSYEKILEQALADRVETLLVFDDDLLLHKDAPALFAEAFASAPGDWLVLKLGTLQYNWAPPWVEWRSPWLYRTNGAAIGSHAVGMRFEAFPFLLNELRRMEMPYDVGALSALTGAFPQRCFVTYPNIAIQALADSDINTSDFQQSKSAAEAAQIYRWNLADYPAL